MKDFRQSGSCMAKTGLLFLRDCGNLMSRFCKACGRPICSEHSIPSDQGMVCPECAASGDTPQNEPGARFAQQRGGYYSRYGYSPYYYGYSHYYSDQDYRTFDGRPTEEIPPPAGAGDTPAGDPDDGMES